MPGPAKGNGGRPPLSIAEHRLRGTTRPDRQNQDPMPPEDVTPGERVKPPNRPSFITGYARSEWDRIVPLLKAAGVIARVDRTLLSTYCVTWGMYKDTVEQLKAGAYLEDQTGKTYPNPARKEAKELAITLKALSAEFGLSPAARTRIVMSAAKVAGSTPPGRKKSGGKQGRAARLLGESC